METIRVYKLFRKDRWGIHPLFIDSAQRIPIGQWVEAIAPSNEVLARVPSGFSMIDMRRDKVVSTQQRRPMPNQVKTAWRKRCRWVEVTEGARGRHIYNLGLSTEGNVIRFAHRPGWHTSREPSLPTVNMKGKVWAKCLIPSDSYTVRHMPINGMTSETLSVDWLITDRLLVEALLGDNNGNKDEK